MQEYNNIAAVPLSCSSTNINVGVNVSPNGEQDWEWRPLCDGVKLYVYMEDVPGGLIVSPVCVSLVFDGDVQLVDVHPGLVQVVPCPRCRRLLRGEQHVYSYQCSKCVLA